MTCTTPVLTSSLNLIGGSADQGKSMLLKAAGEDLRSKRNCAMLALLVGCGLIRGELLGLTMQSVQLREDHSLQIYTERPVIFRTVPIHVSVKEAIDGWTLATANYRPQHLPTVQQGWEDLGRRITRPLATTRG